MKDNNTRRSAKAHSVRNAKTPMRKLPPDPDGLFKRAAARAKKVVAMYDDLYPDAGREFLVSNLLHDLMHLCDRDATLGDLNEEYVQAFRLYESLVAESEFIVS